MLTRCPGCAKEIPETADICPHCKRDFRTPAARPKPSEPKEPPKPAPPPDHKPHLVTRCPGCAREIPESADVCPFCKRDFRAPARKPPPPRPAEPPKPAEPPRQEERPREPEPPRRKEPDLPKHMLADMGAGFEAPPPVEEPPERQTPPPGRPREPEKRPTQPVARPSERPPEADKRPTQPVSRPPEPEKPHEERRDPRSLGDLPKTMIVGTLPPQEEPEPAEPPRKDSPEPSEAKAEPPEEKADPKKEEPKAEEPKEKEEDKPKKDEHRVLYSRCPGCAKLVSESDDICPHCKRDFRTPAEKAGKKEAKPAPKNGGAAPAKGPKELDLPRHMMADLESEPRTLDSEAARVLPPHMLESATSEIKTTPEPAKKGTAVLFAIVGVIIIGALAVPKFLKKEEPPPQPVVEAPRPVQPPVQPQPVKPPEPAPQPPQAEQKPPEPPPEAVQEPPKEEPAPSTKKGKKGKKGKAAPAEVVAETPPPEPAPAQKKAAKTRVTGTIFDLVSLKGVEGVDITFVDTAGGSPVRTQSGSGGNYRVTLPASSRGYELRVQQADYLPKYLADHDYRSMGEDARKEEAGKYSKSSPNNPLITTGDSELHVDFAMIAREKHGMTQEEALSR